MAGKERIKFLKHVIKTEDEIDSIYRAAKKEIVKLPRDNAIRAKARIIIRQADREARDVIYRSIRKGADLGEVEQRKKNLKLMKKEWPVG
jgi:hypothetical protein